MLGVDGVNDGFVYLSVAKRFSLCVAYELGMRQEDVRTDFNLFVHDGVTGVLGKIRLPLCFCSHPSMRRQAHTQKQKELETSNCTGTTNATFT